LLIFFAGIGLDIGGELIYFKGVVCLRDKLEKIEILFITLCYWAIECIIEAKLTVHCQMLDCATGDSDNGQELQTAMVDVWCNQQTNEWL